MRIASLKTSHPGLLDADARGALAIGALTLIVVALLTLPALLH
jgi:hypothetical protein